MIFKECPDIQGKRRESEQEVGRKSFQILATNSLLSTAVSEIDEEEWCVVCAAGDMKEQ